MYETEVMVQETRVCVIRSLVFSNDSVLLTRPS